MGRRKKCKGYELEKGNYELSCNKNAHEVFDKVKFKVGNDGLKFENDRVTGNKVENEDQITESVETLKKQMLAAAENLDFERAAELRDKIKKLTDFEILDGEVF